MSCGWGSGGRNHCEEAGAYLSGCNDSDVAPGGGYKCQKTALVGRRDRRGGDGGVTHLGSRGCVLLAFVLSMAGVGIRQPKKRPIHERTQIGGGWERTWGP